MIRRLLILSLGLGTVLVVTPGNGLGQNPARDDKAEEAFLRQAEANFKIQDRNGDGFLDKEEMSPNLRSMLDKYDKNRDGLISFLEYLDYQRGKLQPVDPPREPEPKDTSKPRIVPPPEHIFIDEGEMEKRPEVPRAGNLPKGLPAWFDEIDMDGDGQIALWEWRKAGKSMKDFSEWDRNDDGLITIEEIRYKLEQERLAAKKGVSVGNGLEFRETMDQGSITVFYVKFEKGKVYQMEMTSNSGALNPYILLQNKEGKILAQIKGSGGDVGARIMFRANTNDTYRIIASSAAGAGQGPYLVKVTPVNDGGKSPRKPL